MEDRTTIIISKEIRKKLQMIKQEKDFKNVNEVIDDLIKNSGALNGK